MSAEWSKQALVNKGYTREFGNKHYKGVCSWKDWIYPGVYNIKYENWRLQ